MDDTFPVLHLGLFCFVFVCLLELWKTRIRPLDKVLVERLRANWQELAAVLVSEGGMVGEMYAKGCVSRYQRLVIEEQLTSQRNKKLLEIMSRKSVEAFDIFVECLQGTNQHPVLYLFNHTAGNIDITVTCLFVTVAMRIRGHVTKRSV